MSGLRSLKRTLGSPNAFGMSLKLARSSSLTDRRYASRFSDRCSRRVLPAESAATYPPETADRCASRMLKSATRSWRRSLIFGFWTGLWPRRAKQETRVRPATTVARFTVHTFHHAHPRGFACLCEDRLFGEPEFDLATRGGSTLGGKGKLSSDFRSPNRFIFNVGRTRKSVTVRFFRVFGLAPRAVRDTLSLRSKRNPTRRPQFARPLPEAADPSFSCRRSSDNKCFAWFPNTVLAEFPKVIWAGKRSGTTRALY